MQHQDIPIVCLVGRSALACRPHQRADEETSDDVGRIHQMRLMYVVGVVIAAASEVPPFVRLANRPLRWRLLTELAASDQRVRRLFEYLGEPQTLVSYHLRLLREGGLVTARRNSHDGRDTYYQARRQAGPGRGPRRQPRRALRAPAVTGATPGPPRSPGSLAGWGWRRGGHRVGIRARHRPTSHRRFATAGGRSAHEGEPRLSGPELHRRSVEADDAERGAVALDVEGPGTYFGEPGGGECLASRRDDVVGAL